MSVDPLAQKYTYNSPYAFAENRVIDGRELEGLEWVNATLAVEVEFAPVETLVGESTMPEMRVALEGMVVEAAPRVGLLERIGNYLGDAWDSITGGGKDVKTENPMEEAVENAKPENTSEQGNKVTKPEGWETKADRKGDGIKHADPNSEHNYIRETPAKPKSPQPGQQVDNVKYVKDGVSYDKSGNPVPAKSQEAHIPATEFDQSLMPPFN